MTKIVQAVNTMIANAKRITNVMRASEGEVFFLYDGKHKWSMGKKDDGHWLWFYPGDETLESLKEASDGAWDPSIPVVTYRDTEIGTKEAKASFAELYTLLNEKVYGVDAVLDDIINDIPF